MNISSAKGHPFCPGAVQTTRLSVLNPKASQSLFNILRSEQDVFQFPDDIFKYIFLNENIWISIEISLKFILKG